MECNKDEACRAKEIAERKFSAKDFLGAKKFALKAHQLYPGLEGLSQMLAVLEVYLAAENKVNGDMDWYSILHVSAFADDSEVKKQYRKLALSLHPDKNKSVGADGAFKLISEAWGVLSDKVKRLCYDQKRNRKGFLQKPLQPQKPAPSHDVNAASANGFDGFFRYTEPSANAQKGAPCPPRPASRPPPPPPSPPPPPPSQPQSKTFWTSCPFCRMQYEYLRMYVNQNLLCPNCQKPFLAVEAATRAANGPNSSTYQWPFPPHSSQNQQRYPNHGPYTKGPSVPARAGFTNGPRVESYRNTNYSWGPFSRTAGAASATASSAAAAAAASVVQQTYEKVRRDREEAQAAAKKKDEMQKMHGQFKKQADDKYGRHLFRNFFAGANQIGSDQTPAAKGTEMLQKKRKRHGHGNFNNDKDDEDEQNFPTMEIDGQGASGTSGHKSFLSKNNSEGIETGMENSGQNESGKEQQEAGAGGSSNSKVLDANKSTKPTVRQNSSALNRELSATEMRNLLIEKARMEIRKKLAEMKKMSEKAAAVAGEQARVATHETGKSQNKTRESSNNVKTDTKQQTDIDSSNAMDNSAANIVDPVSITVPDPDFYDFDKDRTEESFADNQIWAVYDDDDGMPRFYALVQKVVSLNPFKLQMSWLNARNNNDIAPIDWVEAGFTKTCGDFKVGKASNHNNLNVFSHVIRWEKVSRGVIRIFPRKGDVWAIYREWDASWDESTPAEVRHKYDMVEVLTDFSDEVGVSVVPLVKVAGFKTVFQKKHVDSQSIQWVPKKELFRFSHQVPARVLTGEEAQNLPEGCHELDPAATPLDLLQVITEEEERVALHS